MQMLRTLALSGAIAALGAAASAQEDMLELSVALGVIDANFNTTTASVFQLADEMGYFERHGVHVTYVALDGTPAAVAALNSGAVDLADIGIDAAIRLRAENDVPVRGFITTSIGPAFLIAGRDDIQTLADLAGRSFAVADNGSLDHTLTQAVLRASGVEEPSWVAIGAPDVRVQALAAGQVDATTVSYGTWSSIEGTAGLHVILSPDDFASDAPTMTKFVAGLESTFEEKHEAIQRFTDALLDASRALQADPGSWVEAAVAGRPDLTREALERTAQLNLTRWCVNGCMRPENVQDAIDFIYSNPEFAEVPMVAADDLVDYSFTEHSIETMGAAGGNALDARN